jgi:hypothetical protein
VVPLARPPVAFWFVRLAADTEWPGSAEPSAAARPTEAAAAPPAIRIDSLRVRASCSSRRAIALSCGQRMMVSSSRMSTHSLPDPPRGTGSGNLQKI